MTHPTRVFLWIIGFTIGVLCSAGANALAQTAQAGDRNKVFDVVDFRGMTVYQAARELSIQTGLNIIVSPEAGKEKIDLYLTKVHLGVVFKAIERTNKLLVEDDELLDMVSISVRGEKAKQQPTLKIAVKGRVVKTGSKSAAMLEVDGKLRIVVEGSIFSSEGSNYKLESVTALELRIQELSTKKVYFLR